MSSTPENPSALPPASVKLPVETPLPAQADEAFDRFAELVRTVLGVPVALVSLVDQNRQVFPGASGLPEPWASERTTPLSHSFCQHVVISASPLVVADARLDDRVRDNLAITDLGVIAYAGIPLVDDTGAVTGSLCAIDTEPRAWSTSELRLLNDLAAACSAELQLRVAVGRVAAAHNRARLLMELSQALSMTTTVGDISRAVRSAADRLGAQFGGINLLDSTGQTFSYVDSEQTELFGLGNDEAFSIDGDMPSAIAVRAGKPIFVDSIADLIAIAPGATRGALSSGGASFAYLPLEAVGTPLGCVSMFWSAGHHLDEREQDILTSLGGYVAQALFRAQLLAERRDVARVLQDALVPPLPVLPGFELAARYVPANVSDQVGGDWFDAFSLDGTTAILSVGDVSGHDTEAAAAMGQLRASLRTLIIDRPDAPASVLSRLDRLMAPAGHSRLATAVLATLTPAADGATLTWSNAGHLPPLLLIPGHPSQLLTAAVDPLLGLRRLGNRHDHQHWIPRGATVLLFTDGLVERRDQDIDAGLDALLASVDELADRPLDEMLQSIVSTSLAHGHDDDTVLFALRVR
ncbi:GAF domain-containing protein [Jatrophihabitans sp. GAS493]|uniref:GAF domain-containing SpoIIE family protein phosphatase n=1 Tax=Jatrophihabitans sp. GAS493 TaxID=1907575 RepID=UPI000BB98FA8|nr:SpoIIE family protein phosphatase [Jatrophihabitans sp. GAS493]SOD72266.1 GAF domain-containing protein [Jatrophihabitans sp. GAS493]